MVDIAEGRGGTVADLMWLAVVLLIIALANSAITNVSGYFGDLMSVRLRAILSANYYRKLLRLPQRYYDNELTGTIISRLNRSITSITDFLQTFSNGFFPTVVTLLAVLVITAFYSPWLTILLIVIYPTFVWLTARTSKKWQVWEKQKNDHYDISGGRFSEVIGQMRVVKSFVTERSELESFKGHYRDAIGLVAAAVPVLAHHGPLAPGGAGRGVLRDLRHHLLPDRQRPVHRRHHGPAHPAHHHGAHARHLHELLGGHDAARRRRQPRVLQGDGRDRRAQQRAGGRAVGRGAVGGRPIR